MFSKSNRKIFLPYGYNKNMIVHMGLLGSKFIPSLICLDLSLSLSPQNVHVCAFKLNVH